MFARKVLIAVLSGLLPLMAAGQESRGRINGLVTDTSGAVIPRASATLLNEETKVVNKATADAAGAYIFEYVQPGVYTVTVEAPGFKQFVSTHVRVEVAAHIGINAKLQVGATNDTVTVNGTGGDRIRTEDAVLGFTVEARSLNDLPILYSNPFDLQLLAPGVASTSLTPTHTYEGGTESATINGAQSGSTEFTLDGAPETRNGGAVTTAYIPSRDFVGEVRLITSPYDASLSHTSGGSIDSTLKNGTSQFHGGAELFEQPSGVDAPQYSLGPTSAPVFIYNRESGEVDGPILRKKLYFFVGYEKQYNKQAASTTTQTVPTDAEKKGDFSALLPLGTTLTKTVDCTVNGQPVYAAPYNSYQIFNPFSTTPDPQCPGQYLRTPYQNNMLPSVDAVAAKILAYYPEPTGSASQTTNGQNNYVSNISNTDHYWSIANREDYDINDKQKLFGHYIQSKRIQPHKNAYYPGASGQTLTLKNYATLLDYTNALNATTVLDLRYSFTRFTTVTSLDATTTSTDLGINPNALAGAVPASMGFPEVSVSGFATLGNSDPGFEADQIHVGQVNLSKSLGAHQVKAGAEYRLYQANQFNSSGEHLHISATGAYTRGPGSVGAPASSIGQGLAALEDGQAEGTSETLNTATSNNTYYWSGYVQDDWKATPKLTLNIGLRYEYGSPVEERYDKSILGFDPSIVNPVSAQALANYTKNYGTNANFFIAPTAFTANGGLVYANQNAKNQQLWTGQTKNISPRIGFAWNPTTRLVVRAGYGIFYSHLGEYVQYANSLGFTQTTTTVPTTNNGLTFNATLENPFPNGLVAPPNAANGSYQGVGTSITFFPQHPATPYNERFSFGLQYQLPGDIILEADYVGSQGKHVRITRDYDAIPDSYLSTDPTRTTAQQVNATRLGTLVPNPFLGIAIPGNPSEATATTIANSQLVRPFPEYTDVTANLPSGSSNYNSLQVSAQKRFSHGYNMSVAYTQSKQLDAITFLNAGDLKPWYGVSNQDYPRLLSTAAVYELPFGKGKPFFGNAHGIIGEAIGGFQIEGTYRITSGQPITFSNAAAILQPGYTFADIGKIGHRTSQKWFNTLPFYNEFDQTSCGTAQAPLPCYQNASLQSNLRTYPLRFNNVRQDYQNLLNAGAIKKFTVAHERVNMVVRAEALNAMNHPVFSAPTSDPSSTSFGKVGGFGNQARVLQFAVEAHF